MGLGTSIAAQIHGPAGADIREMENSLVEPEGPLHLRPRLAPNGGERHSHCIDTKSRLARQRPRCIGTQDVSSSRADAPILWPITRLHQRLTSLPPTYMQLGAGKHKWNSP